jgi:hypothetical protein
VLKITTSIVRIYGKWNLVLQGGSNMTGTDFCVNKPHKSRSYLKHHVYLNVIIKKKIAN